MYNIHYNIKKYIIDPRVFLYAVITEKFNWIIYGRCEKNYKMFSSKADWCWGWKAFLDMWVRLFEQVCNTKKWKKNKGIKKTFAVTMLNLQLMCIENETRQMHKTKVMFLIVKSCNSIFINLIVRVE